MTWAGKNISRAWALGRKSQGTHAGHWEPPRPSRAPEDTETQPLPSPTAGVRPEDQTRLLCAEEETRESAVGLFPPPVLMSASWPVPSAPAPGKSPS